MPTDRELIKRADKGRLNAVPLADLEGSVNKQHRRVIVVPLPTDADGTVTNDQPLLYARHALKVISCYVIPGGALTAHDTNYTTLTLVKNDAAGGAPTTVGTLATTTTGSGNWVVNVPEAFTLTASAVEVAAGQLLALDLTLAGSGVTVPASHVQLEVEEI